MTNKIRQQQLINEIVKIIGYSDIEAEVTK